MKKKSTKRSGRYEEMNPVVSFRVPKEDYDHVRDKLLGIGKPMGQFIRDALNGYQNDIDTAHSRGVREGFERAKRRYAIYLPCNGCNELVALSEEQWKTQAANALFENMAPIVLHEGCKPPHGFKVEDCETMKGEFRPKKKES